jgi:hypothetical protein
MRSLGRPCFFDVARLVAQDADLFVGFLSADYLGYKLHDDVLGRHEGSLAEVSASVKENNRRFEDTERKLSTYSSITRL